MDLPQNGKNNLYNLPQTGTYTQPNLPLIGMATQPNLHQNGMVTQPNLHQNGMVTQPNLHQNGMVTQPNLHQNGMVTQPNLHQNGMVTQPNLPLIEMATQPNLHQNNLNQLPSMFQGEMVPSSMLQSGMVNQEGFFQDEMDILQNIINDLPNFLQEGVDIQQNSEQVVQVVQPAPYFVDRRNMPQALHAAMHKVHEAGELVRKLRADIDSCTHKYQGYIREKTKLEQGIRRNEPEITLVPLKYYIQQTERELSQNMAQIKQFQSELVKRINQNISSLTELQRQVLDLELVKWKREQQLNGNGVPMTSNLNTIQEWCELLAEATYSTRQQLITLLETKTFEQADWKQNIDGMINQVKDLLLILVQSTFVIEKQPPQLMKTKTPFSFTVRLLVGGQLNVHRLKTRVTTTIISEQTVQLLEKNGYNEESATACGDMTNYFVDMNYDNNSRQLLGNFKKIKLEKINRSEKKGQVTVTDEKFCLLVRSIFKVEKGDLVFNVTTMTLSLPVVVIVHGSQEPHAWATVTWDNAFAAPERVSFHVPDKVPWCKLAETLRVRFRSATGADLTKDNLRFLAEKISRTSTKSLTDVQLDAREVSRSQFCKDNLPNVSFTFTEWFYHTLKLSKHYLSAPLRDGLIHGFIHKTDAEKILFGCPPGTFLLRFSESVKDGGIVFTVVAKNHKIVNLDPRTSSDLAHQSLGDFVLTVTNVNYLYPNIDKQIFAKYSSVKQERPNPREGYVEAVVSVSVADESSAGISSAAQRQNSLEQPSSVKSSSFFSPLNGEADKDSEHLTENESQNSDIWMDIL